MNFKQSIATLAALATTTFATAADEPETIGLNNLIELALQRDFQIRIVQINTEVAKQNARSANGFWDPAIRAQYSGGALGGGGGASSSFNNSQGELYSVALDANLPTGARLTLDGAAATFENPGSFDTFAANAGLSITQPLLQNFGGASSKSRIKIAKRTYEQSQYAFKLEAISTVTRSITIYNQVALAKASLEVAEQSRELARKLVKDTATRARLGTEPARGVEVAETRLSQREATVVTQQRLYLDVLNELKRLVSNEALKLVQWQVEVSRMPEPIKWSGELDADFDYALLNRPDYRQALIEMDKAEIQAKATGSEYLPQLDVSARVFRTNFSNGTTSSLKGLSSAESDVFVGVTFRRAILNTTAGANRAAARLRQDQSKLVEQQLQQAIAIQLDNASRQIQAEARNRELTEQGRKFAIRSLEAEERKLKLGQSTPFFVLESQEDLANAQNRELAAIANYNIAVARYHQAKGSTLELNGIDL